MTIHGHVAARHAVRVGQVGVCCVGKRVGAALEAFVHVHAKGAVLERRLLRQRVYEGPQDVGSRLRRQLPILGGVVVGGGSTVCLLGRLLVRRGHESRVAGTGKGPIGVCALGIQGAICALNRALVNVAAVAGTVGNLLPPNRARVVSRTPTRLPCREGGIVDTRALKAAKSVEALGVCKPSAWVRGVDHPCDVALVDLVATEELQPPPVVEGAVGIREAVDALAVKGPDRVDALDDVDEHVRLVYRIRCIIVIAQDTSSILFALVHVLARLAHVILH